jgi:hypothetical protein
MSSITWGPNGSTTQTSGGYNSVQQANLAAQQAGITMGTPQAVQWVNNYLSQQGGGSGGSYGGASTSQPSIPGATAGSTVTNSGSNTQQTAGPNGPFSGLTAPLSSAASNTMAAGQTALNTGMAGLGSTIYNQQLQQQQNQTNVNEAQRGITMSPYGAGVANQADINFNSNWQNQQLARDQAGISAATSSMAPAQSLYGQSYGSSTQGYGTQPPQPVQQQVQNQQGQQQPETLAYPNLTSNNVPSSVPYSSPIGGQQPNQQGLSNYQPPVTNYNAINGYGGAVDNNLNGPYDYSTGTDPTVYNSQTADYTGGDVGSGYTDYSGSGGGYSPTLSSGYTPDPSLMSATNDSSALDLLAGW